MTVVDFVSVNVRLVNRMISEMDLPFTMSSV